MPASNPIQGVEIMRAGLLMIAVCVVSTLVEGRPTLAFAQSATQREAQAVAANPVLSDVESVRFLGTFIDCLTSLHRGQVRYNSLKNDDLVGRMTELRGMTSDADLSARRIDPFTLSKNDTIRQAADGAKTVFSHYKSVFERNVALYEQLVRIFTVPHELTDAETSAIAEARITGSKLGAEFSQASDLLKDVALLVFASTIVPAPGDHVALDMSQAEKHGFVSRLHRDFGGLENQSTVAGPDIAALSILINFNKDWRLAR
jgi:hypothetical protein